MAGRRSDSERDEMLDKVMGAGFYSDEDGGFGSRPMEPDTEVPSHLTLEIDEDGAPTLARFTYVDEDTCIGCKNCAFVARSTFFMEESFAGKARVFQQGGDDPDLVDEAIDSCPVSCIHHVSHEDLVTLERERLAREDNLDFNNYASFKRGWTGQEVAVPETQAQYYGSLAMGTRCNNCPSRGCASCPMFGVGKNPVYLQRLASREEKKVASGEAQREQDDRDAAERINTIYAEFQSVFGADLDKSDEGLAAAFKKVDTSGDGKISSEEMRAYITKVYGKALDEKTFDAMMKAADVDGDGEVDLDEFKVIMRAGEYAGAQRGSGGAVDPFNDAAFNAIFDDGYSFDALETEGVVVPAAPVTSASSALAVDEESEAAAAMLRAALDDESGVVEVLEPYAVLGVKRDASLGEIKRAFRRLALRWHPDRCSGLPELERLQAELIFKQINLANEVLSNAAKRRQYDDGTTSFSELVSGFWQSLTRRMRGEERGVVIPSGSGISLKELASAEEADTGIAPEVMLAALGAATEDDDA